MQTIKDASVRALQIELLSRSISRVAAEQARLSEILSAMNKKQGRRIAALVSLTNR